MAVASGYAGGFECSFIGDVEDFECPLCLHVTRDPYLTSCCGQHFCQSCISRIITDRKPCPFCKESRFTVLLDKKQKRRVLDLKVKCIECDRGCSWTGPLGDLDNHGSKDCGYKYVWCPNGCGKKLQRRVVKDHLEKSCPKRNFTCKYCGHQDTYKLIIRKHMSECPKYPVFCPNNCTPNTFERASLKEHIEQDCPLQQVDCEYKSFGCTTLILRKDLSRHMEDNIQQHMLLVTKELKKTKEKLSEAEGTIATLTEKVTLLENNMLTVPFTFYVHRLSQLEHLSEIIGQYTFTTHMNGYKLYLKCSTSNNNCMVFYIGKIATENDNNLQWPLRCTVILTILDQNNDQVHKTVNQDVCVKNNASVAIITYLFDLTSAEIVRAISNDRLLLKFDIVNVNKYTCI